MLTPANVKILGNNHAELTKDGKKLLLQVNGPANLVMKTWSTDPPKDYDAPNPGTTLVGFELTLPAHSKTILNVSLIPEKSPNIEFKKIRSLEKWNK